MSAVVGDRRGVCTPEATSLEKGRGNLCVCLQVVEDDRRLSHSLAGDQQHTSCLYSISTLTHTHCSTPRLQQQDNSLEAWFIVQWKHVCVRHAASHDVAVASPPFATPLDLFKATITEQERKGKSHMHFTVIYVSSSSISNHFYIKTKNSYNDCNCYGEYSRSYRMTVKQHVNDKSCFSNC